MRSSGKSWRHCCLRAGRRLLEIGAGFGRITGEYDMFQQVVLLDYSLEQLQYARRQYGDDGFLYVAADAYRMPFQDSAFDAATMIRVIHHFENVPAALGQDPGMFWQIQAPSFWNTPTSAI